MEQAILAIGIPPVIGTGALFIWVWLDIWYWMRRPDDDQ
jgi:O-antigen ligase